MSMVTTFAREIRGATAAFMPLLCDREEEEEEEVHLAQRKRERVQHGHTNPPRGSKSDSVKCESCKRIVESRGSASVLQAAKQTPEPLTCWLYP